MIVICGRWISTPWQLSVNLYKKERYSYIQKEKQYMKQKTEYAKQKTKLQNKKKIQTKH